MIKKIPQNSYECNQDDRDRLLVDCANKINELIDEMNEIKKLIEPTNEA